MLKEIKLIHDQSGLYYYSPSTGERRRVGANILNQLPQKLMKEYTMISKRVFKPSEDEWLLQDDGYYQHNTFKSYQPNATSGSTPKPFLELLRRLFPDPMERHWFTLFIAHMLQQPQQRPTYGLMLSSEAGTGKGYLFHSILRPLFCDQVEMTNNYSAVFGKHSTLLKESLLLWLDDAKSNHSSTMTRLRNLITEPTVLIEEKHRQQEKVDTYARVILASNELTPLELEEHDRRRWWVPQYIQHQQGGNETEEFIGSISRSLNIDDIYHYLMGVDLSEFDPFMPPDTEAKEQMFERARPEIQKEIEEFLELHRIFEWSHIKERIPDYSNQDIQAALNEIGYVSKRERVGGERFTLWCPAETSSVDLRMHVNPFD